MKIIRTLIRTLFVIPLAAIVYFAILVYMLFSPPSFSNIFSETQLYRWNKIRLGRHTVSGDGSGYHIYSKRGSNNNLILFFSGGGMAWDDHSAFAPTGITSLIKKNNFGYYFSNIPMYTLVSLHGMLDSRNEINPFHGWNIIYIPYSTGDMHIGDNTASYVQKGITREVHHNGRYNTLESLRWVYENFESPDKVMVCGDSAGAFAAAFWAGKVARHYTNSEIFCVSDGAHLKSGKWPAIIDGIWKAQFQNTFGYNPTHDPLAEAFINTCRTPENRVVMLHVNTVYDKTLAAYQADVNATPKTGFDYINQWTNGMLGSVKRISASTTGYHFYLTSHGYRPRMHFTPHTILRYPRFYKVTENGIAFTKWLDDVVNKGMRYNVGEKYIKKITEPKT